MAQVKHKKVLLLWSGGADSTYLLDWSLREGYEVDTVYLTIENNVQKTKREKEAIKSMITSYFSKYKKHHHYEGVSITLPSNTRSGIILKQAIPLLMALFYNHNESHEQIAIGYIMNDDAISFLDEINSIWNSMRGMKEGKSPLQLWFPLSKKKKFTICEELQKELRPLVTWCESGDETASCGKCVPMHFSY